MGWDDREDFPMDDSLFLQGAQIGGQDLLADGADGFLQLAEAAGLVKEIAQNQNGPLVAQEQEGGFDWAGW